MAKKRTKKTKLKGIDAQLATGGLDKALAGGKSRKKGSGACLLYTSDAADE